MKNLPTILFYLLILVATSCGSKKKVFTSVSKVTDSLIVKVEKVERPPLLSSLTIDEICDSVTNRPVKFKKIFVVKNDTIEISTIDNQLRFKFQAQSEVIKQMRDELRVKDSELKESSEKVKYHTDFKLLLGALIVGLVIGWVRPWRFL